MSPVSVDDLLRKSLTQITDNEHPFDVSVKKRWARRRV